MKLAAIVVTDLNNAIGKNGQLLCHLPADLKFFKATTMGCPIIMGRKTYESMGRVLPGRRNIIISRNANYKIEGAEVFSTIQAALEKCNEEKIFIIGGGEIYRQSFNQIDELYRTLIHQKFDADTYFPEIKKYELELVWEEKHLADDKNKFDYSFQKWVRKGNK